MKITYFLGPLASIVYVVAHGDTVDLGYKSPPVSFTEEGISNTIHVGIKSPKGKGPQAIENFIAFFKRNPRVLKAIKDEASKPEYAEVRTKALKVFGDAYTSGGDLYEVKLKAITYTYENPDFLEFIQKIGSRVMNENRSLVDDFFEAMETLTKKNPIIVSAIKEYIMEFSETNEKVYKQAFEMVLRTALINPGFSGHLVEHVLRVDRLGCGCTCKGAEGSGSLTGAPTDGNNFRALT